MIISFCFSFFLNFLSWSHLDGLLVIFFRVHIKCIHIIRYRSLGSPEKFNKWCYLFRVFSELIYLLHSYPCKSCSLCDWSALNKTARRCSMPCCPDHRMKKCATCPTSLNWLIDNQNSVEHFSRRSEEMNPILSTMQYLPTFICDLQLPNNSFAVQSL